MKIVFMGTPDFAVPSLRALAESDGVEVVGVVCQPDRPKGRGGKLQACPVKVFALSKGLRVYQFERIRRPEGVEAMLSLRPDAFVTAAFGQILSQELLDIPRIGTINVHASLLPKYRGSAPINWAIIKGERETGVTTMMTDKGMDTGDMLLRTNTAIGPEETAGELTQRLSHMGAALLMETLAALDAGNCPRAAQDPAQATYDPMLSKETGRIDWNRPAEQIANLVRGVNPWPGAWTTLGTDTLKILKAAVCSQQSAGEAGLVLRADPKGGLIVAAAQGALELVEIQAAGSKRMPAKDYLRGHVIPVGTCLGKVHYDE